MGTECNSDSVGKTDSYCVSKMVEFVVVPAGMGNSDSVGKTDSYCVSKTMGFVVIPAGMW